MTAIEEIRQAITTLERLKAESTPGPWNVDQNEPAIWTSGDSVEGGTICYINSDQQTGDHRPYGDAELIVTLHRTIDAQLAILQHALEEYNPRDDAQGYIVDDGLELAHAINGSQSA